jgi:hypothetical protein
MLSSKTGRLISAWAVLGLSGCAVSYDQNTDQQVTAITQEGDQQLATWENMLAAHQTISYDASAYSKIQGDLQTLEIRLASSPDFETSHLASIVASQITLWNNIRDTQIKNPFVYDYLNAQAGLFNYNMGLLTLYELSLKSGTSTSSAGAAVTAAKNAGPTLSAKPAA